jgi:hypothetical protein
MLSRCRDAAILPNSHLFEKFVWTNFWREAEIGAWDEFALHWEGGASLEGKL